MWDSRIRPGRVRRGEPSTAGSEMDRGQALLGPTRRSKREFLVSTTRAEIVTVSELIFMRALETLRGWHITPYTTYFSHPAELGTTTFDETQDNGFCIYEYFQHFSSHQQLSTSCIKTSPLLCTAQLSHFDDDTSQILSTRGRLHSWTSVKDHAVVPKRGIRGNRFLDFLPCYYKALVVPVYTHDISPNYREARPRYHTPRMTDHKEQ